MRVGQVLDANANRAREALRVMEEVARFVVRDAALVAELKAVRHALASALPAGLERFRDVAGDAGTAVHTSREFQRDGVHGVAIAAGKRLGEAMRSLEEFGKLMPGVDVVALKQLRYRGYRCEQRLLTMLGWSAGRRQWRMCVLLTRSLCKLPWDTVLREAMQAGADCVQVREKDAGDSELLSHVRTVVSAARLHGGVSVVVNDRPDIAVLAGADGVHVGQGDLPCDAVRLLVGSGLCVGVTTSNVEEARRARDAGADYCGVGPMFATTTKHKPVLAGPAALSAYLAWGGLPHLAIGGVTAATLPALLEAEPGLRGVAVSAGVCSVDRPGEAVSAMLGLLPAGEAFSWGHMGDTADAQNA